MLNLFEILDIKPGWLSSLPAKRCRLITILARCMDIIPINCKLDQKTPETYLSKDVNTTCQLIEGINAGKDLHFLFLLRANLHTELPAREHVLAHLLRRTLMRTKLFYSAQMFA